MELGELSKYYIIKDISNNTYYYSDNDINHEIRITHGWDNNAISAKTFDTKQDIVNYINNNSLVFKNTMIQIVPIYINLTFNNN